MYQHDYCVAWQHNLIVSNVTRLAALVSKNDFPKSHAVWQTSLQTWTPLWLCNSWSFRADKAHNAPTWTMSHPILLRWLHICERLYPVLHQGLQVHHSSSSYVLQHKASCRFQTVTGHVFLANIILAVSLMVDIWFFLDMDLLPCLLSVSCPVSFYSSMTRVWRACSFLKMYELQNRGKEQQCCALRLELGNGICRVDWEMQWCSSAAHMLSGTMSQKITPPLK